jgi:hypothetical protein
MRPGYFLRSEAGVYSKSVILHSVMESVSQEAQGERVLWVDQDACGMDESSLVKMEAFTPST